MKILHFSVFFENEHRHGGTKRSEQLVEILSKMQSVKSTNPYVSFESGLKLSFAHPFAFVESILFFFYLFLLKGLSLKGCLKFSVQAVNPIILIKQFKPDLVYLETAPGVSLVIMQYFKWKNINFVAMPHNIEFMVPRSKLYGFSRLAEAFACEVDGYKAAKLVKVISEYDKSLLACLGIESEVLPYYPTIDDEKFFLEIRNQRYKSDARDFLLLLGTVNNPPTYNGMVSFLQQYAVINNSHLLIVAGYGTEQLTAFSSEKIEVVGTIDSIKLRELLVFCTALIINQPQTTGFLTKIVDFNLCGIPMVVTSNYFQADHLNDYGVVKTHATSLRFVEPTKFFSRPVI
jgi:hypothetical protein